ncbi:hypothetical protein C5167_038797 [Papaver somniferum]|uniref:Bidirectional sugar transporter SWEET n=1 Tax=Papaver somniferum TaxID=3469 RepID=A0A4Y7IDN5_PAPSO|nr:hypothetical protein C5167_038797 [Papaver somniferum]
MISSTHSLFSDAAGVTGNLFAFVLFVSPIPTFSRIVRNRSTEQFSGLPYIYTLLNCLICLWYGLPHVSPGIILVATVNSVGAVFQLVYVILFIVYADKGKKMRMLGLLLAVFGAFVVIAYVSMTFFDSHTRQLFVGCLSVASLISMFASPLFVIVCLYPALLSEFHFFTFNHMCTPYLLPCVTTQFIWFGFIYRYLFHILLSEFGDPDKECRVHAFLSFPCDLPDEHLFPHLWGLPNGIGTVLGAIQLSLYAHYSRMSGDGSREPLIPSFA